MATSQNPHHPRRRPAVGDRPAPEAATPPGAGLTPDATYTPGHPNARGTLPMAKYLTDPAIEEEIQVLAAEAPLPTVDQAARIDLIRPTAGTARVLGMDPRADAVELHRRIGYLAGDVVIDARQKVGECLNFLANLRGGVPAARIIDLADRLDLDLNARVKSLSKGNRQKVGLVQAFMHQPELLILDEPTFGLNPLVQRTFLALVTEAQQRGQTVFMSSGTVALSDRTPRAPQILRRPRCQRLPPCCRDRTTQPRAAVSRRSRRR
jgi:ABC-type ATPase involved in cell division